MTGMLMERGAAGMAGMTTPGVGQTMPGATAGNWMMVPRCTMRFEKCPGGMKVVCSSDDQMGRAMMQSLCDALRGGMCSCCVMMNGLMVCCCSLTMGLCKCEVTAEGCCVTCTSGDPKCAAMIQACCDALATLCASGCHCCLMMNNTPVCCSR